MTENSDRYIDQSAIPHTVEILINDGRARGRTFIGVVIDLFNENPWIRDDDGWAFIFRTNVRLSIIKSLKISPSKEQINHFAQKYRHNPDPLFIFFQRIMYGQSQALSPQELNEIVLYLKSELDSDILVGLEHESSLRVHRMMTDLILNEILSNVS